MKYVMNQWYAAATSDELNVGQIVARQVLGQDIVLFRGASGRIGALEDRCPHRMAPLSLGEVDGEHLRCGYHGALFSAEGRCVHIPCQPATRPEGLDYYRGRSFPVVEKFSYVFVWMGDPEKLDETLLPDWAKYTGPGWKIVHGYQHVEANYVLLLDNINDLTHLPYVHRSTFGKVAGSAWIEAPVEVKATEDRVTTSRAMRNVPPALFAKLIRGMRDEDRVDRFQTSEFSPPGFISVVLGSEPHQAGLAAMRTPTHVFLNALTPADERQTHYFWCVTRNEACENSDVSKTLYEVTKSAFDEDKAMLEAQQRRIDTAPPGRELLNFRADQAVVATRRILERLSQVAAPPKADE